MQWEFSPEKRPDRAIRIARTLGIPLKIAAKVDKADEAYSRETIAPLLSGPGVEFVGEINERSKTEFLGEAQALLFPIDWPEPFGLVMIEAMACGTPVLAYRHGSVSEIIDQGVTGAIVDTMDEAVMMLPRVMELDRRAVRRRFEQRFSSVRKGLRCGLPIYAGRTPRDRWSNERTEVLAYVLAPTLHRGDIVIMDNLKAHKVAGVMEAIEAVGVTGF